jgi:hypothetical protein
MRKILFLICVLGLSCVSLAQVDQASWANLDELRTGQNIQVVEIASKKHSGVFVSVSDTAITYRDTAGQQTAQKLDIRSVKLMENTHRLRNTFIGAGVGAAVVGGMGAATSCSTDHCFLGRGVGTAIGAVIGGVGGAIVGVLLPSHGMIYNVSSH